jgi:hypothetical protein
MLYLALFGACIAVELSPKIHTDNILKKIAIGFIAVGSLVEYVGRDSIFIEVGILVYLVANLCTAYCSKPKRRSVDR